MAGYPPPYPPPPGSPSGPPYGGDWKYQRRILRDQARAQRDQYRYQRRAMRRRSILGPVVLVAVGIVFLLVQTGHLQNDLLWDWYGHWWPFLLILAGVVLLAEWGIDHARPQDPQQLYVRRSIGGGVFSLLALLAIVGLIVGATRNHREYFVHGFGLSPDNLEEFLGDKHESDQVLTEAFPAGGSLSVDNPRGDVSITGISADNQIHISLHKQVYSRSDSDAENKARELSPKLSTSGNILCVSLPTLNGAVADLTISVPASAAATINANHGDVQVNQLKAPVTITANHGDVSVSGIKGSILTHINNNGSSFSAHDITGPVSLEGHVGDLTLSDINGPVSLSGEIFGSTHLEHITSSLKLHTSRTDFQLARLDGAMDIGNTDFSADQCVGPVVLTTGNRNITLERITGDLSVTNRNGSVDLISAPPMGNVTVQNRNGSVSLTVPDHANFTVSAETSDGDVENDFSLSSQERDNRKTLNGTVGKGGSLVRINTSQGDVAVKKASIAPLPPMPPRPPAQPADPAPQVSIQSADGSSVYVGKDGVRVTSGSDGSSVIIGKDGLNIKANSDGSSSYRAKDGTELSEGSDGSKRFIGKDGTHYTEDSDGSKVYKGKDGSRISIGSDGSRIASGPGGKPLSESEIQARLRQAQEDVRHAEHQRDVERSQHRPGKNDD